MPWLLALLVGIDAGLAAAAGVPLYDVVQVAAGGLHTCTLTSAGAVKCWGANEFGQLGNGTQVDATAAVDVAGLAGGVTAIAAGLYHTCAVVNGGVECWGSNSDGQLGNGTSNDSSTTPVAVTGLASGVTGLAAGTWHTCAVVAGAARCWGFNGDGQLGTGTFVSALVPTPVAGLAGGVTALTAGRGHSCAIVSGGARCWGSNFYGQLGIGVSGGVFATPTAVPGLASGVSAIAAGDGHTCAVDDGGAYCWGRNDAGALGNGTTGDAAAPVGVVGLVSGVTAIEAGDAHTCALVGGLVRCWGLNGDGQLGADLGVAWMSATPVTVLALPPGATALAAGGAHTCAALAGQAHCWGSNARGQLGNGNATLEATPVDVAGLGSMVSDVSAGVNFSCAAAGGSAWCWGANAKRQLANATFRSAPLPQAIPGLASGVASVVAGMWHACALVDGGVRCWGDGTLGQLGNGGTTQSDVPVAVSGLASGVTALAAGALHTCAIQNEGAKCWGWNGSGQIGDGTTAIATTPVAVTGLAIGVAAIAAGEYHTCAVVAGAVKCWGYNGNGELGSGTSTASTTAVDVIGLASGATGVAAGDGHSCAVVAGSVKCWGFNSNGQLGNGTTASAATPTDVVGLATGVVAVTTGRRHSCAIVGGAARCWGQNILGALGDGTTVNAAVPVDVAGLATGVTRIDAGANHSCAVVGGAARCWGANESGELGNGVQAWSPVPSVVVLSPPTVVTAMATGIWATGATLHGTASSNGASATIAFQYGPTTNYSALDPATPPTLSDNAMNVPVSATVGGLACNTLHHFRIVGMNDQGAAEGADLTFTTAACTGSTTSTTTLASDANPAGASTRVNFTATVTGAAPTGTVAFLANGGEIPGCGAIALAGTGDTRRAVCNGNVYQYGANTIVASYGGDAANTPSASAPLVQQIVAGLPVNGAVTINPYGAFSVSGGSLNGNQFSLGAANAAIQLGTTPGTAGSFVQIDFASLHVDAWTTLTIRSGAPGQAVVLNVIGAAASAIGGTLKAEGGNGAPPPVLEFANPNGVAIAASGQVLGPSGLHVDALGGSWTTGRAITNAGIADGGPFLELYAAGIHGGGAFRGNAIGLHTSGNANNPVNGADYLRNGLQLHPSTGTTLALTLNGYGPGRQVFNLYAHGDATVWMPSAWPAGFTLPTNNAVVAPGGVRPAGVPEPAYGGGSMIVQASGSLQLHAGGSNDFAFPGAIVLKAGGTLDFNGVTVNQGWTTTGQSFQGLFFEALSIVSAGGLIRLYGNDLNWMNFSVLPQQYVRAYSLKRNGDGSASFAATDTTTPHLNTYSVIQGTAAAGGCWVCLVNTAPVNMYGP